MAAVVVVEGLLDGEEDGFGSGVQGRASVAALHSRERGAEIGGALRARCGVRDVGGGIAGPPGCEREAQHARLVGGGVHLGADVEELRRGVPADGLDAAALLDDEEAAVQARFLEDEKGGGEAEAAKGVRETDAVAEGPAVAGADRDQREGREPSHGALLT